MAVTFIAVAIGCLAGLTKDVAANLAASFLYDKSKQQDLFSLLQNCLAEAVKEKSRHLESSAALTHGSVPLAHIDTEKLSNHFAEDKAIDPIVNEASSQNPWRPYLWAFEEIIVVSNFRLSKLEHLDLIQQVLDEAARLFTMKVPSKHPAFEQLLLSYQEKHSEDHQRIFRKIDELATGRSKTLQDTSAAEQVLTDTPRDWVNPFSIVAADDLDLTNPEHVRQIRSLFIARYTDLPTIQKRYNTILEGQRGCGKTMIMKHLAFETQILEWTEAKQRSAKDFLSGAEGFIGVYSKLGQGVFDKTDYEAIPDDARRERIFEHRLTLHLMSDVLQTMRAVYQHVSPSSDDVKRLKRRLNSLLRINGNLEGCLTADDLIKVVQEHISSVSVLEVDEHLGSVSPGGTPTNFNPRLTLSGALLPFLDLLRETCGTSAPFFLMLDDFDVLEPFQQERVFKTASARRLNTVCFKFGIMVYGMKVLLSGEDRTFRTSDDFNHIDLDWTEGGLHENYRKSLIEIADARLEGAGSAWKAELSSFLPEWLRGNEIMMEVRATMESEWDAAIHKPTDAKSDYISKYGSARFFQTLRQRKIRMRYAGLESITMVSSGIYRQFLEICKLIFDRAHDEGWVPEDGGVRSETQDEAVREYSDEMIQQFSRTSGDAQSLLRGNIVVTSSHMVTLLESLCDLFYSRLHTPPGVLGSGEPEIICVAVRDELSRSPEADTLLKIAVRESILHRFQYPPKTSGGPPLPAFMLNRRLGPRRDLSITRMQGRIEIQGADIVLAANERRQFFEKIQGKKVNTDFPVAERTSEQPELPFEQVAEIPAIGEK